MYNGHALMTYPVSDLNSSFIYTGTALVECETCFQWFHYRCVGIANERDTASWNCWSAEEDVRDNDLSDETNLYI